MFAMWASMTARSEKRYQVARSDKIPLLDYIWIFVLLRTRVEFPSSPSTDAPHEVARLILAFSTKEAHSVIRGESFRNKDLRLPFISVRRSLSYLWANAVCVELLLACHGLLPSSAACACFGIRRSVGNLHYRQLLPVINAPYLCLAQRRPFHRDRGCMRLLVVCRNIRGTFGT
jgi:hypothetical protein